MQETEYRVVVGAGDWGSPVSEQPVFKSWEEAQAAAREYIAQQRNTAGGVPRAQIEETRSDGTVVRHDVQ
jgi:hypothetical protein